MTTKPRKPRIARVNHYCTVGHSDYFGCAIFQEDRDSIMWIYTPKQARRTASWLTRWADWREVQDNNQ